MAGPSILSSCSCEQLAEKSICSSTTVEVLKSLGFTQLTKIQLKVLPHLLSKENCYIHARTGSGKTLAFLVPTVERLRAMKFKDSHGVGALVISPTRELAQQTAQLVKPLADAHGLSSLSLVGGNKDKAPLERGAVIVVATPGRLCKVLKPGKGTILKVKKLKVLILDEADKLLDDGTHTDHLRKIYSHLPTEKLQKILVSATVADDCLKLAKDVLQEEGEFMCISTEAKSLPTTEQVKQSYISVGASDRLSMLITVLKTLRKKKVIVFFNSCQSVKFHNQVLAHFELPVLYSMGQEKQNQRNTTYSKFWDLKRGILLTTGMAERGWDIPGVHWIIIYDPPHKPEDYIHRIGRTGRGDGEIGEALLFLRPEENQFIDVLHNMKVKITELEFGGELKDIQNQVTTLIDQDKSIQEKAKIAYKKFIRAYQCHSLKTVFSIESLNLTEVCKSFGFAKPPMYLGHLK
ncbi:uncharacterized protein [Palaemon carinicauda]|uniref:uncharacterized protein n=1 Tax=Palaemon carinicauda TaxID=392227 RepID=UPI0035B5CD3B